MKKTVIMLAVCVLAAAMCFGLSACGGSDEAVLTSVSLKSGPTKTEYAAGDAFDPSGAVITAVYSDGSAKDVEVTAQMCAAPDMSAAGKKDVVVSYSEGGEEKTVSFTITVRATANGADVAAAVKEADAGEVINLDPYTTYTFRDFLDLDKKITVRGGEETVFDFSQGNEQGKAFRAGDTHNEANNFAVGLVNIYADGVSLENVKIVGDLDKAVSEGEQDMSANDSEMKAAYGIFISRYEKNADTGKSATVNVKETITLRNVEITETALSGIYAYCIYADDSLSGDALEIDGLKVYGCGDLQTLKASACGIMFQSGKGITLHDVDIDAADNGPAVYVHMSTKHGPITFTGDVSLAGAYNDADDKYGFAYAANAEGAGAFAAMKTPLMIHCNIDGAQSTDAAETAGYLPNAEGKYTFEDTTFSALSNEDPYLLVIGEYFDSETTPLTASNYAARPARWGSPVFCIDLDKA
ncbi:MAG TPA: bacterial Ig-like domain-containing protein [Firmicutes bacterium]|nr:bacterial Ig-like domain-containing protein [Bacillota bacterium]